MVLKSKQLASLVAAGAGAMALTSGKAEASIISSGILNTTVGFTTTFTASTAQHIHQSLTIFAALYGAPHFGPKFGIAAISRYAPAEFQRSIRIFSGAGTSFGRTVLPVGSGVTSRIPWTNVSTRLGSRKWGNSSSATASFSDQYIAFKFNPTGSLEEYGWIEASLNVTQGSTSLGSDGPALTIVQYSYDNTGASILTGEGAATPEPATLAESGIAALILGAEGLRRMRKARKAA